MRRGVECVRPPRRGNDRFFDFCSKEVPGGKGDQVRGLAGFGIDGTLKDLYNCDDDKIMEDAGLTPEEVSEMKEKLSGMI